MIISCHSRQEVMSWSGLFVGGGDILPGFLESRALISISTPGRDYQSFPKWNEKLSVLELEFDDLDRIPLSATYQYTIFSQEHVERICRFVISCLGRGVVRFYIHCDQGISRSAGVAGALSEYFNGESWEFFLKPRVPNIRVYQGLLKSLKRWAPVWSLLNQMREGLDIDLYEKWLLAAKGVGHPLGERDLGDMFKSVEEVEEALRSL